MKILKDIAMVIIPLLFIGIGIISICKPQLMTVECQWIKYAHFYRPSLRYSNNPYYLKQIRLVGIGFLIASILVVIIIMIYKINPNLLLFA
jgi:hypothetical protein